MRMPTLRPFGEGCMTGEVIDTRTRLTRGAVGSARRKGGSGNRGRPVIGEGSGLNERGWETGRCRMAQATALILDSTEPEVPECAADFRLSR